MNNIIVCMSDMNVLLFFVQICVIMLAQDIIAAAFIIGSELLLLAAATILIKNLKIKMLSKNGTYWFYFEHVDDDGTAYGTLIINEHCRMSAKLKKKVLGGCCWAKVGNNVAVTVESFHPFRLREAEQKI